MSSNPFSDWLFPKVCQLYSISNNPNLDINIFPPFSYDFANLNSNKFKAIIKYLIIKIKLYQDVTLLNKTNKAIKSIYSYCYLAFRISLYKDNFKLILKKFIKNRNKQENFNYVVKYHLIGRVLDVIEVKKEDFMKGFV